MRGFATCLIAGFVISAVGLGLSVGAAPAPKNDQMLQTVDRSGKGDRIPVTIIGKQLPEPVKTRPTVLTGCDPAFSPLSASARYNFARSCIG
jgi:hypothetical protein